MSRDNHHIPKDWFWYMVILPAVWLADWERFIREERAAWRARRDRWRVW